MERGGRPTGGQRGVGMEDCDIAGCVRQRSGRAGSVWLVRSPVQREGEKRGSFWGGDGSNSFLVLRVKLLVNGGLCSDGNSTLLHETT